ncbi:Transcriptional regulator PadR-like family protein [Arthrobacter alpinus]|uniref:Transcriptional regulator PadR-like family protein n=1 Tax=Arthrobacter alpinus TaxID=656366 RepID=A0A1H5PDC6_9MICC|nr:helix-turn-helix transcriptional regulator [Arthrobacter alpinus]SEF11007.1 Transcriptional regulator PadR-like family protein [Arthrobacter alpinus]
MENLGRVTPATALVLEALLSADRIWGLQIVKDTGKKPGTIYPILDRLEAAGWIVGDWDTEESRKGPRRRYYKLVTQARPSALAYVETQRTKDQPAYAQLSPVRYQNSGCTA